MLVHNNSFSLINNGAFYALIGLCISTLIYNAHQFSNLTYLLEWQLISTNGINLTIQAFLDHTSTMFAGVVIVISLSVVLFTTSYINGDPNIFYFLVILSAFVSSIIKLIICPHLINLIAGWDGLGLSSYLLVIYYINDNSMAAGILTLITNRIGDALLIAACALSFSAGQWNFVQNSFNVTGLIMLLLMIAAITNSAQMPFSAWLPAAIAAPTPVSALVHSSTLVTAGIYLLIRFYPSLTQYIYFQNTIILVGVSTCLIASISATCETDLNNIIALSTLSQLGVIIIAIGLSQPNIAFFHLVTHALFKALLFICAGNIIHSIQDNQDIRLIGNIFSSMPVTTTTLNIANLSLCGFPFIAGFYSNDAIAETLIISNTALSTSVLIIISITMTSAYTIRLSIITLWSPFNGSPMKTSNDENILIYTAYFILLTGAIIGGALGYWIYLPSVQPMIIPTIINISTLLIVTFFALIIWFHFNINNTITGTHFISSIWFLTFITSFPIMNLSNSVTTTVAYNEMTWIENLSGNGSLKIFSETVKALQKSNNITLSELISLISALWFIAMIMYFVY